MRRRARRSGRRRCGGVPLRLAALFVEVVPSAGDRGGERGGGRSERGRRRMVRGRGPRPNEEATSENAGAARARDRRRSARILVGAVAPHLARRVALHPSRRQGHPGPRPAVVVSVPGAGLGGLGLVFGLALVCGVASRVLGVLVDPLAQEPIPFLGRNGGVGRVQWWGGAAIVAHAAEVVLGADRTAGR